MGIFGAIKLKRRKRVVIVGFEDDGKPFEITLRAPGLQAIDEVNERLKEPSPPIMKNPETNNPIQVRDEAGNLVRENGQILLQRNKNDPAYKKAMKAHQRASAIALFYVMCSGQMTPSKTIEECEGDWQAFYLNLWEDLEAAGVGVEKFNELSGAAESLLRPMNSEELEDARKTLGTDKATDKAVRESLNAEGKPEPQGK